MFGESVASWIHAVYSIASCKGFQSSRSRLATSETPQGAAGQLDSCEVPAVHGPCKDIHHDFAGERQEAGLQLHTVPPAQLDEGGPAQKP